MTELVMTGARRGKKRRRWYNLQGLPRLGEMLSKLWLPEDRDWLTMEEITEALMKMPLNAEVEPSWFRPQAIAAVLSKHGWICQRRRVGGARMRAWTPPNAHVRKTRGLMGQRIQVGQLFVEGNWDGAKTRGVRRGLG